MTKDCPAKAEGERYANAERCERAHKQILAAVDAADAALARGEGRIITPESMRDLAAEIKQRGRVRLAAEHARKTR